MWICVLVSYPEGVHIVWCFKHPDLHTLAWLEWWVFLEVTVLYALCLHRYWVDASSQWCRSISSFYHKLCRKSSLWPSPAWQRLWPRPRSVAPTPAPKALTLGPSQSWRMPPAHGKVQLRYAASPYSARSGAFRNMGFVCVRWKADLLDIPEKCQPFMISSLNFLFPLFWAVVCLWACITMFCTPLNPQPCKGDHFVRGPN